MKKILAFNGSPRSSGNTAHLLDNFLAGATGDGSHAEVILPHLINLEHCHGCLRCNVLKRCSLSGDDWNVIAAKILEADVLVFATPIYFHHVPGPLKMIIDRFRSFVHVQITETGLIHTPWHEWRKDFVLLLSLGSSDASDADPVIDLFSFITTMLGSGNRFHHLTANRLAVVNQVIRSGDELAELYKKLKLPGELAGIDYRRNRELLERCRCLGTEISNG